MNIDDHDGMIMIRIEDHNDPDHWWTLMIMMNDHDLDWKS